jgi:transcriptional regulator with PAS, ATPase and Fis domain
MNLKRIIKPLARLALEKLQSWHWPCNVRELKNVITRACVLAGNKESIEEDDIQIGQLQRWTGYQRLLIS